mmetsp:Transcript_92550/g.193494  ORF Transcript_92550/g.193494 Transcript_92550/m.193494 type:complete len:87 (-) Transcript_92550:112-372(-)
MVQSVSDENGTTCLGNHTFRVMQLIQALPMPVTTTGNYLCIVPWSIAGCLERPADYPMVPAVRYQESGLVTGNRQPEGTPQTPWRV